eukprot:3973837-Prymnesium_polylepis.1
MRRTLVLRPLLFTAAGGAAEAAEASWHMLPPHTARTNQEAPTGRRQQLLDIFVHVAARLWTSEKKKR